MAYILYWYAYCNSMVESLMKGFRENKIKKITI